MRRDRISPFDRSALRRSVKETLGVGVGDSEVGRVIDPEEEADRSSVPTDWRPPRNHGGCRTSRSIREGARPSRVTCAVPTESRWIRTDRRVYVRDSGLKGKSSVGIFSRKKEAEGSGKRLVLDAARPRCPGVAFYFRPSENNPGSPRI